MPDKVVIPVRQLPRIGRAFDRVAIYARVSTRSSAQLHSMAAQVSELTRFAASRMDWRLADVYMDFESGATPGIRPEYTRMVEDALAHRIDVVIVKSVQRFGRNTEEIISTMRKLLSVGVIVFFQIEGYSSDMPEAELMTALRAGLAAQDNASRREDREWGKARRVEDGSSELYKRPCYGYEKNSDGMLVINANQAEVVKSIFQAYLSGKSIYGIKSELEAHSIPSPTGKSTWAMRTIDMLLSNEKYTGKIVLFKTVMVNYPYSVRKDNAGGLVKQQYMMTNGVDAIIDEDTFTAVQAEKKRRSNYETDENGRRRKKEKYSSQNHERSNETE